MTDQQIIDWRRPNIPTIKDWRRGLGIYEPEWAIKRTRIEIETEGEVNAQ